jgi:hypothetical protein
VLSERLEREPCLIQLGGDLARDQLQRGVRLVARAEMHGHAAHVLLGGAVNR